MLWIVRLKSWSLGNAEYPFITITLGSILTNQRELFLYSQRIIIILLLQIFLHQLTLVVFHWTLSDCKSPLVSRTLLSILANLNIAVFWMVSVFPLVSNSSRLSSKSFGTPPCALITISITVIFMFPSFFSSLARTCLSFHFLLFSLSDSLERQNQLYDNFSFFVNYH